MRSSRRSRFLPAGAPARSKGFTQQRPAPRLRCAILACTSALLFSAAAGAGTATFTGIGDLEGAEFSSRALGISPDGGTVLGTSRALSHLIAHCCWWTEEVGRTAAFLWTQGGGMVEFEGASSLQAASIAGHIAGTDQDGIFRWSPSGGYESLGPGGGSVIVTDISVNGSVIVGSHDNRPSGTHRAFRWSETDGLVDLIMTPPLTYGHSRSEAVSADGSVIVGDTRLGPFRWTAATGMQLFGSERIYDISPDGGTIVGNDFAWTEQDGFIPVADTVLNAVSRFGSLAVGFSTQSYRAVIWDHANGVRDLQDVLENHYGLDLTGWNLSRPTDVSADGRTITGYGWNPAGDQEGWVVVLPPQCDDGFDNDGDGLADDLDPECSNPTWHDESKAPAPACGLGFELVALVPLLHRIRRSRRA